MAIVDGATHLSYADLQQRMYLAAEEIRSLGIGPGDVVAIWSPNSWQWVVSALASWWCGCVIAPIPARGRILDAMPILQATRAKLLFTCSVSVHGSYYEQISQYVAGRDSDVGQLCPDLEKIVDLTVQDNHPEADLSMFVAFDESSVASREISPARVSASDVCEILFTSGSTGDPKGVLRQHAQVLRNRRSSSVRRGFSTQDVLLAISEFSHTLGLNGTLLRAMLLGATLAIPGNKNPKDLANLIHNEGVTAISAAPSLFSSLLLQSIGGKSVCANLRLASIGSSSIPPELVYELLDVGVESVVSGYGMTECDSIASTGLTDTAERIATSVGVPEAGLEVQIADDDGLPVSPGSAGEILIRGYAVSPGYLNLDGQTGAVAGADGWFRSGDIGCWSQEGFLRILGRKKDVICIHGYTLYPTEIEVTLSQSEMLDDVAVIGVPHAHAGEMCVAFIVPKEPLRFSLNTLRAWARKHMADYKIPSRFVVLDALPLGGSGKVDRLSLRNMLNA